MKSRALLGLVIALGNSLPAAAAVRIGECALDFGLTLEQATDRCSDYRLDVSSGSHEGILVVHVKTDRQILDAFTKFMESKAHLSDAERQAEADKWGAPLSESRTLGSLYFSGDRLTAIERELSKQGSLPGLATTYAKAGNLDAVAQVEEMHQKTLSLVRDFLVLVSSIGEPRACEVFTGRENTPLGDTQREQVVVNIETRPGYRVGLNYTTLGELRMLAVSELLSAPYSDD